MTASFDIQNSTFGIRPVPPKGNVNFAWVQHFIHHLAHHGRGTLPGKLFYSTHFGKN